jgi:hypothetical protein
MSSFLHLLSCATCITNDDKVAVAANSAIGFMLVVLVGVLGSFGGFIFHLARKAKNADASQT